MSNRGQIPITIATAMAAVSFVAAPIIAYYSGQSAIAKDIDSVRGTISSVSERTAKLETSVPLILDGVKDLQEDMQDVKKALWIPEDKK